MHLVLNNSNFQQEIHAIYMDIASFGTGALAIEEDEEDVVCFSAKFIGDIYIKPARVINFIQLNFVAVRSGVEFSEIVGN